MPLRQRPRPPQQRPLLRALRPCPPASKQAKQAKQRREVFAIETGVEARPALLHILHIDTVGRAGASGAGSASRGSDMVRSASILGSATEKPSAGDCLLVVRGCKINQIAGVPPHRQTDVILPQILVGPRASHASRSRNQPPQWRTFLALPGCCAARSSR